MWTVAEGFLGRWSKRKQALRAGSVVAPVAVADTASISIATQEPDAPPKDALTVRAPEPRQPEATTTSAPAPTLEDVQALTPEDSFARFVAPDVSPTVRNAAMKKLFADPHYNVMDGLDIYIDDYSLPSPLPASMLQKMVSAQFLKLVQEPETPEGPAADNTLSPTPLPNPPIRP